MFSIGMHLQLPFGSKGKRSRTAEHLSAWHLLFKIFLAEVIEDVETIAKQHSDKSGHAPRREKEPARLFPGCPSQAVSIYAVK